MPTWGVKRGVDGAGTTSDPDAAAYSGFWRDLVRNKRPSRFYPTSPYLRSD